MTISMLTVKMNYTADNWIALLDHYSFDILLTKPDLESWSLGQVAMHIVYETAFYMEQVEYFFHSNENISGEMTEDAKRMFNQNSFPDIRIKRESSLSHFYPQPDSRSDILERMRELKVRLNSFLKRIETNSYNGKTKHHGLGYFSAQEWIQFAETHMRHHFRQKDRVEAALRLA